MCSKGPANGAPPFGLNVGQWYSSRFSAGGGISGNFNWIDFTPPSGGESELSALMTGSGVCNLNVTTPVGQTGVLGNAMAKAFNSRFGLYMGGGGNPSIDTATADFTGYSYTATNWPAQSNALGDFLARRNTNDPYGTSINDGNTITGLNISNAYNPTTTPAQHKAKGADRRLVVAPCRLRRLGDQQHDEYRGVGVRSAAASDRRPERRRVLRVSRAVVRPQQPVCHLRRGRWAGQRRPASADPGAIKPRLQ
jgi:hypothetical protein